MRISSRFYLLYLYSDTFYDNHINMQDLLILNREIHAIKYNHDEKRSNRNAEQSYGSLGNCGVNCHLFAYRLDAVLSFARSREIPIAILDDEVESFICLSATTFLIRERKRSHRRGTFPHYLRESIDRPRLKGEGMFKEEGIKGV